jgi:cytochrome c556
MLRTSQMKQNRSAPGRCAVGPVMAATLAVCAVMIAGSPTVRGEDRVPGLTGIDHADDVVQARQLLMDVIDADMMSIDLFGAGTNAPLNDLKARADRISSLLSVFPHLFPPQTKPSDSQAIPTTATPAVWTNFDDFYGRVQAAAMIALDASRAETADKFKDEGKKLRAACDSCHAQYMHVEGPHPP